MFWLSNEISFPPVESAHQSGLLAIGGDLSTERLILAYENGIFPWYNPNDPICWYSPDPRMVLFPKELKVSKSLRQLLKKEVFHITYNQHFEAVISKCKNIKRKDELGTWITDEMQNAYIKLHQMGLAKSVEVWLDCELVGGLYGIDLGHVFCGESMFSSVSNASKVAFVYLAKKLASEGCQLIDCQVYTSHLESLGAKEISRNDFMKILKN